MNEVRLIDANALKERVNRTIDYAVDEFDKGYNIGIQKAVELIDNAPTVEPEITEKQAIAILINSGWLVNHDKELRSKWERPQGEWITVHYAREELNCPEKSMLDFVKCPFCETIHQGRHNFCSRCGADMRGEKKCR